MIDASIFVSKRSLPLVLTFILLMMLQIGVASCEPEPTSMAARASLADQ
jgi:hypothetical protein